ncbi:MAG: tetratricopeptide repeat protein [Rhodospirillaceae bacterium]|nr:tetratricopeptide repeat protein [Rhodospirillaceae bacterium]
MARIIVALVCLWAAAASAQIADDPVMLTQAGDRALEGVGAPQDDATAFDFYRRAAELGHAPAQFKLGVLHAAGRGTPQSDAAAADWYRKAVAQNYIPAMANLGVMYMEGRGVTRDPVLARLLLSRAAEAGDKRARDYLITHAEAP